MMDAVYEVDSDDDLILNIYKLPYSNLKQSSLFVSLYVLAFYILRNI